MRRSHDAGPHHLHFSLVHCSIWDERGVKDVSSMPEDFRQQRQLMGTLVASPFVGRDENGKEGTSSDSRISAVVPLGPSV